MVWAPVYGGLTVSFTFTFFPSGVALTWTLLDSPSSTAPLRPTRLARAGVFGKVTNDQPDVLKEASEQNSWTYIDSPVDFNNYDCLSYWFALLQHLPTTRVSRTDESSSGGVFYSPKSPLPTFAR